MVLFATDELKVKKYIFWGEKNTIISEKELVNNTLIL